MIKYSFLNNIRRGLGSAYIELRESSNKTEYIETLIYACVHDSSYELMVEGPKGEYLFSLIRLFDEKIQSNIESIIIRSLCIKDSRALLFQKLTILESYYYEQDKDVSTAILDFCLKFMNDTKRWDKNRQSAFEIVAIIIDRIFGIKQTKNILKFIIDKKLDTNFFEWYFCKLSLRYKNNSYIIQLIERNEEDKEKIDIPFTLENLLVTNDSWYISCYSHRVDDEEYNKTVSYLKNTTDIVHIKKILEAYSEEFVERQLPVELCFNLLEKYGEEISESIYDVVEHYKSFLVERLSLQLISENKFLEKALTMLFNNYSKKYKKLIIDTYKKIKFSFNEYNPITYKTINFMNHTRKDYPDEILLINYKKSYDSFNREYIVDIMKKRKLLTPLIIEECQYDFDYELNKKAKKWKKEQESVNDSFIAKIIECVPNSTIRDYLNKSANTLSVMQLATLVDNFCSDDYVEKMRFLIKISNDEYERRLLNIAINEYKKYGSIDEKTCKYYRENDSRETKPLCPFQEYIELPQILNDYDLGKCLDNRIVVVGKIDKTINFESEFGDLSYLTYDLDNNDILSIDTLFRIHGHVHYCELTKFSFSELSEIQKNRYYELVSFMKRSGY